MGNMSCLDFLLGMLSCELFPAKTSLRKGWSFILPSWAKKKYVKWPFVPVCVRFPFLADCIHLNKLSLQDRGNREAIPGHWDQPLQFWASNGKRSWPFLQWVLQKSNLPVTKTKSVTFTHIKLNSEFPNSSSQSHCWRVWKGGIVKLLIFFFFKHWYDTEPRDVQKENVVVL